MKMLAQKQDIIRKEVAAGTGAGIELEVNRTRLQTSLRIWFADLPRAHSPIVELSPAGLRRIRAVLKFGNFSSATLKQMMGANAEEIQLARALVASVSKNATVTIEDGQSLEKWKITEKGVSITAEKAGMEDRFDDDSLVTTCQELVTPILAAMAELYGYDPVELPAEVDEEARLEGAVTLAIVRRRERNPRNRLLCIRLHGARCQICGLDPIAMYGDAGAIIEVHHLQPLSATGEPRAYDPRTDLVPLCPNCHRAIHTRKPLPWTPGELKTRFVRDD